MNSVPMKKLVSQFYDVSKDIVVQADSYWSRGSSNSGWNTNCICFKSPHKDNVIMHRYRKNF